MNAGTTSLSSFKLLFPKEILFGAGEVHKLPGLAKKFGTRVFILTGASSFTKTGQMELLHKALQGAGLEFSTHPVDSEPSPELVNQLTRLVREQQPQVIIAIGGGSVLDAGKAVSAMAFAEGQVEEYLEGMETRTHDGKKIPFIAVPTTAGTGSEATKNAVLSQYGPGGFKKSLRHDNFIPDIALVDPALTLGCPRQVTAACGMDAFTQLLESYVSTSANIMTDSLAFEGLSCIKNSLLAACADPQQNISARSELSYAALVSGITLANAGLGTVHGFASVIGGLCDIPHGVICGTLMGETNKVTIEKLLARDRSNRAVAKYARVGRLFTEQTGPGGKDDEYYCLQLIALLTEWTELLQLPRLSSFGISKADIAGIAGKTGNKNNPAALDQAELITILTGRL